MTLDLALAHRLATELGLHPTHVDVLDVAVNDVAQIEAPEGTFALKLYHPGRTRAQVAWEVDLVRHLGAAGAPVALPVPGPDGAFVHEPEAAGGRVAVLSRWASGTKPRPGDETYVRLGEAAARIHAAADGFPASPEREAYDAALLVDDQLRRMRPLLRATGQWDRTLALGQRLRARLRDDRLDRGVCHLDLTLDNVLEDDGRLTAIDFDSAGPSWRAIEPYGVLRFSRPFFAAWLAGYRAVRPFGAVDEAAVEVFGIVGDLRVVTWKLGLAVSSGAPLLSADDLPGVVDDWLAWEEQHLRA